MATLNTFDRQAQFIRLILVILGAFLAIVGWARWAGAQSAPAKPAVPVDPVKAIVDAFRTHSVVALTAGHGDARGYVLGRMLASDPRIAGVVNDIVIEEGSARGQMHFQRKNIVANYESEGPAETMVSRLESQWAAKVFTIFTAGAVLAKEQPDVTSWPAPSIAVVRGTILGAADFTFYYPSESMGRFAIRNGTPDFSAPIPRDQWKTLRAENQFDAVLYTGEETPTRVRPSAERCADKADIAERLRRATLSGVGVQQLRTICDLPL